MKPTLHLVPSRPMRWPCPMSTVMLTASLAPVQAQNMLRSSGQVAAELLLPLSPQKFRYLHPWVQVAAPFLACFAVNTMLLFVLGGHHNMSLNSVGLYW